MTPLVVKPMSTILQRNTLLERTDIRCFDIWLPRWTLVHPMHCASDSRQSTVSIVERTMIASRNTSPGIWMRTGIWIYRRTIVFAWWTICYGTKPFVTVTFSSSTYRILWIQFLKACTIIATLWANIKSSLAFDQSADNNGGNHMLLLRSIVLHTDKKIHLCPATWNT